MAIAATRREWERMGVDMQALSISGRLGRELAWWPLLRVGWVPEQRPSRRVGRGRSRAQWQRQRQQLKHWQPERAAARCSLEPGVAVEVEGVHVSLAAHAGHVPPHAAWEGEGR